MESTPDLNELYSTELDLRDTSSSSSSTSVYVDEWIQTEAIASVVLISLLIVFAVLGVSIHKECWKNFTTIQMGRPSARFLFILFVIALICFYLNSIAFTYTVSSLESHEGVTICYRIGYELGKTLMSQFFVLRLWLTFKDSIYRVKPWILVVLGLLSSSNTIYQMLISFTVIEPHAIRVAVVAGVTTIMDGILMWFFVLRLFQMTNNVSEVIPVSTQNPKSTLHSEGGVAMPPKSQHSHEMVYSSTLTVTATTEPMEFDELPTPQNKSNETVLEIDKVPISEKVSVRVDHEMLRVMTKFMVLSLIGISSSIILQIRRIIAMLALESTARIIYEVTALRCIDGAINIIVMYLMFSFADPYYYRLCKWCDIVVKKGCVCATEKAALRKAHKTASEQTHTI